MLQTKVWEKNIDFPKGFFPMPYCKKVKLWCRKNGVQLLLWVENSPDINSIEGLQNEIKDKIHGVQITSKTQLREQIIQVWLL